MVLDPSTLNPFSSLLVLIMTNFDGGIIFVEFLTAYLKFDFVECTEINGMF